ncbi:TPA: thioredoxin family protein [Enterococcus faecium]|uniref:Thioredoxin n=1 Tax=Enterococcus faecium TaxID=1352 RepID=A0AB74CRG6_ENTFC|nr:thioredoxin family protein [Enterococcus faecium]EGP5257766.1 thioredoxin [Enterococcus faecium]EME7081729.1 thioredoxin family protein [Enterococcus faecium]EME7144772.1 thioredoxin family protein [Enterococcus faecium]EME8160684.1 thioredoxin family protein [Enterococcus faecium]
MIFILTLTILISSILFFYCNQKNFGPLVNTNNEQIQKLIDNKGSGYVYVGRPSCEECQKFLPNLKSVLNSRKETILYYDTDKARKEDQDKLVEELNNLDIKVVPAILYVEKGKVSKKQEGTISKSQIEKFLSNG